MSLPEHQTKKKHIMSSCTARHSNIKDNLTSPLISLTTDIPFFFFDRTNVIANYFQLSV